MITAENIFNNKESFDNEHNIVETGFSKMDSRMPFLREGLLSLVAGRPAMGKTMLALNIVANIINRGEDVCYFTLRTPAQRIANSILDTGKVKEGSLEHLYIDDDFYTTINAREMIESMHMGCPDAKMVVIDNIQFIGTECIQWLYGQFPKAATLILSQASRKVEERESHIVGLDDIPNLNFYYQYVDYIASIYRDAYYDTSNPVPSNIMNLINLRNRDGKLSNTFVYDNYSISEIE